MRYFDISKISLYLIAALTIFLCAGCERQIKITAGDFQGMTIGMSKDSVRSILSQQGVDVIYPEVDENITFKDPSEKNLHELYLSSGICMSNGSGFDLQVAFDKDENSRVVYSSTYVDPEALGIDFPQGRQEMMGKIKAIVDTNTHMTVSNCILDVKSISVKDTNSNNIVNLQRFNSWFYNVPHSYSTATLHFTDGRLSEIDYIYRREETP